MKELTVARLPQSMPAVGWQRGVCCDVHDMGIQQTQWGLKRFVEFVWELEERDQRGRRLTVSRRFTPTLADTSSLRRFLEVWQGHPFTPEALAAGINFAEWYLGRDGMFLLEPSPRYRRVVAATPRPAYAAPVVRDGFYVRRRYRRRGTEPSPAEADAQATETP